jgi:hypothetical protein
VKRSRKAVPDIQVWQPANGWTAVVRGDLTKATSEASPEQCRISIASRVARKFYGILVTTNYEEDEHESWRKYETYDTQEIFLPVLIVL